MTGTGVCCANRGLFAFSDLPFGTSPRSPSKGLSICPVDEDRSFNVGMAFWVGCV